MVRWNCSNIKALIFLHWLFGGTFVAAQQQYASSSHEEGTESMHNSCGSATTIVDANDHHIVLNDNTANEHTCFAGILSDRNNVTAASGANYSRIQPEVENTSDVANVEEAVLSPVASRLTKGEQDEDDENDISLGSDMGIVQSIDDEYEPEIMQRIVDARSYIQNVLATDPKYDKVRDRCFNTHESCTYWAVLGECQNNPGYMTINCAPVCQSCDKLHVATRCPLDPSSPNALERPGDLNALFERIVSEPYFHEQYGITVLSRPDYAPGDGPDSSNITYHVGGSWVLQFDRAVADHEADRLIELGTAQGYERSADVGAEKEDGTHENYVNEGRTSTNTWCFDECMADPIALNVTQRIANITGILETNFENFQLLRYGEHQFYNVHNDFIEYQVDRPCGSRVLTFYMYLNDVENGGGTNFPILNLTVLPKKGRALLWPSVLDSDPFAKDPQSDHQALPVLEGIKYGANVWLHQRDFQNANRIGCA